MDMLDSIAVGVVEGDRQKLCTVVRAALDDGIGALEIINGGVVVGLDDVGRRFQTGELFLPEMIVSAVAAQEAIELASEGLEDGGDRKKATMVLGTVRGDVHDIGKNLVGMLLRIRGIEVVDLGVNVGPEEFVESVSRHGADFVGMSALLTSTMGAMADVISGLSAAGLRDDVRVIVGGAPLDAKFAAAIGADAYARDMAEAAKTIESMLDERATQTPRVR
ncbi:MAG: cobalamin-binding protein [Actinobacteria bacterium]|nr:cobalamin-binding protein [Actinomycetota bacterium]